MFIGTSFLFSLSFFSSCFVVTMTFDTFFGLCSSFATSALSPISRTTRSSTFSMLIFGILSSSFFPFFTKFGFVPLLSFFDVDCAFVNNFFACVVPRKRFSPLPLDTVQPIFKPVTFGDFPISFSFIVSLEKWMSLFFSPSHFDSAVLLVFISSSVLSFFANISLYSCTLFPLFDLPSFF